jgi:molybdopterin/thiamine biosynthesis adenylyltransferase
MNSLEIEIVGTGAVGRQLAVKLATNGFNFNITDPDTVEDVNLGVQGFFFGDLGRAKVDAVADVCRAINPEIQIKTRQSIFKAQFLRQAPADKKLVVASCVDSIAVRKWLYGICSSDEDEMIDLWLDARVVGKTVRVFAEMPDEPNGYSATLFDPKEAAQGRCTAKITQHVASMAADWLVDYLSVWLVTGQVWPSQMLLNVASRELIHGEELS